MKTNCGMASHKPYGSINMDIDTPREDFTLKGTPNSDSQIAHIGYGKLLPRFLDILERHAIKATFFVIGKDLKSPVNRGMIRQIANAGHEIANHTLNHRYDFSLLRKEEKRREVVESQKIIEDTVGKPVLGFRAPGYTVNQEVFDILRENHYLYDSSVNPSLVHICLKWIYRQFRLARTHRANFMVIQNPKVFFSPRKPFFPGKDIWRVGSPAGNILEIPITSVLGVTFVSWLFVNKPIFISEFFYFLVKLEKSVLNFSVHDVEFISPDEQTEIGERFFLSSMMLKRSYAHRLRYFDTLLIKMKKDFQLLTLTQIAERVISKVNI